MIVDCFTSITTNYLAKARVLAESVKRHHPAWRFHVVFGEPPPPELVADPAPFDSVLRLEELGIPDLPGWVFCHTIVELCTGVKGPAMLALLESGGDAAVYLDPDVAVFSPLTRVEELLASTSIVLTPHILEPETTYDTVIDNEVNALKHGVFNLGFLAVRADTEGRRFARWWRDRLVALCYDEIPRGLFTDQRWCDLVPALFTRYEVLRDPGYDVATWNLSNRRVTVDDDGSLRVGERPLAFYHFSGFDSGAGRLMLSKYAEPASPLFELWDWYERELDAQGQARYDGVGWRYSSFADGTPIEKAMRRLYRDRRDLQLAYPDPFVVPADPEEPCFLRWCRAEHG